MTALWIVLGIAAGCAALVLLVAYVCFRMTFYSSPKRIAENKDEYPIPDGKVYEPFHEQMIQWIKEARSLPYKEVSVTSFDGLTLRGRYYEYAPDAPIELLFHGYRGWAERDLSGGVARCFALGRSALIVDHRGSNKSDGTVITFGILESRDCPVWVDYILHHINPDAKIIITGISMGAATVMIAASRELPKNVVGVLADCGYTSAEDIIKKVMQDMKLPPTLLYPFVRLGGKLFGKFDVDETSPLKAMAQCRLPAIFFHGEDDDYVPYHMSMKNYDACPTQKKMVSIKGAGHGLCFPVDPDTYLRELKDFFDPILQTSEPTQSE